MGGHSQLQLQVMGVCVSCFITLFQRIRCRRLGMGLALKLKAHLFLLGTTSLSWDTTPKGSAIFPKSTTSWGPNAQWHDPGCVCGEGVTFYIQSITRMMKNSEWLVVMVTQRYDYIKCYSVVDLWMIKWIYTVGPKFHYYLKIKYTHFSELPPTPFVSPLAACLMWTTEIISPQVSQLKRTVFPYHAYLT